VNHLSSSSPPPSFNFPPCTSPYPPSPPCTTLSLNLPARDLSLSFLPRSADPPQATGESLVVELGQRLNLSLFVRWGAFDRSPVGPANGEKVGMGGIPCGLPPAPEQTAGPQRRRSEGRGQRRDPVRLSDCPALNHGRRKVRLTRV
jgi:hypothetical protein